MEGKSISTISRWHRFQRNMAFAPQEIVVLKLVPQNIPMLRNFLWKRAAVFDLRLLFPAHCSAVCLEKLGSVKKCHYFHLIVPPCLVYTLPGTANVCLSWVMLPAWRPPVMPLWSRWSGFKITAITVRSEWCFKSENPNLHQTCLVDGAVSLLASGVDHLYIPHALLLTLWNRLIFHPNVTLWWWWILITQCPFIKTASSVIPPDLEMR